MLAGQVYMVPYPVYPAAQFTMHPAPAETEVQLETSKADPKFVNAAQLVIAAQDGNVPVGCTLVLVLSTLHPKAVETPA